MNLFRNSLLFLLIGLPLLCIAANKEFYGRSIPTTAVIDDVAGVLTLRGVALDKYFFEDNYIGAFYTLNPVKDEKEALIDAGPKRMAFYFLRTNTNFRAQLQAAIEENNSPQMVQRDQINISQFLKIFDLTLKEGDVITFDFIPNVGMKIMLRGNVKAVIKDTEIYNLVLKTWMGRQPPSKKFRKELFNLT